MKKFYLLVLVTLSSSAAFSQILFEDDASIVGITQHTGQLGNGNGLSFADYDNDGWDDITLPSGNGVPLRFYKNYGGFFVEETLLPTVIDYQVRCVNWVDFDNDGDRDLFIASDTSNGNKLFRRNQDGTFEDITIQAGLPTDNLFTYGVSWGDYNNDGCLDFYLSNRVINSTIINYFFKNNCDGTFSDVTGISGLETTPALTLCAGFLDINNDGFQDLYVSNDKQYPNFLYKNNGDGTFSDISNTSGTNISIDAMSVTIDDYDSDGYFDLYITNTPITASTTTTAGSVLYRNNGDETFTDVSIATGTQLSTWSWGSNFFDAENDGDLDLYVSASYISSDGYPSYGFYENQANGTFSMPSNIGFVNNEYRSYGSAIGDINNDGKNDIAVINNFNSAPNIWVNKTNTSNNYISINLEGVQSNRDGVGSVIEISVNGNKQYRYITNGESYLSQNSFKEIFGLGSNTLIDYVKVTWLSGIEDVIYNVSVNQFLNITEGSTLSTLDYETEYLKLWPNPVKGLMQIENSFNINKVIISNGLGQFLFSKNVNDISCKIDLSNFSEGVYFITIFSEKGILTKKILKV